VNLSDKMAIKVLCLAGWSDEEIARYLGKTIDQIKYMTAVLTARRAK